MTPGAPSLIPSSLRGSIFGFPARGCGGNGEVGTAGAVAAVGFVEAEDRCYVCSVFDLLLYGVEEGGAGVTVAGAPEHGDELHVWVIFVGRRWVFLVVVVPCWWGWTGGPDLVVVGVIIGGDVDEAAF